MRRCTEIGLGTSTGLLRVSFSDGKSFALPHELLRVFSPSAEVRAHDGTWDLPARRKGVRVKQAEPVGNYAVRLVFDDGHDTGLYSFDLLHDLGSNKMRRMREYIRELKKQGKTRHRTLRKRT